MFSFYSLLRLRGFFCLFFILTWTCSIARADLVAHWPLDGNAEDVVGGRDGSISGGLVFGAEGAAAHTGTAAEFNGSNAKITVPHSTALNPASFTLSVWANADSTGGFASAITSRDDDGSTVSGYIIYNDSAGRWNFWTGGGGGSGSWPQLPGPSVQIGSWTHIAISYNAGSQSMRLYINGQLENSATGPGLYSPNGPQTEDLHIGAGADNGSQFFFDGLLDDVALWDEALSEAEIQSVMTNGVPGGPPIVTSFSASPPFIDSGQSTTLSWNVVNATSISIAPGVGPVANPSGSVVVSPNATTTYTLTAVGDSPTNTTAQITIGVDVEALPPVLNEFLADNEIGITDGDGDREDWIEIYNPNPFAIDLAGWSLTDDPLRPDKWEFPTQTLEAGGYLIVFASEKDLPLHANFRLDTAGEYLALVDPDGNIIQEYSPTYPPQFDDISFGVPSGGGASAPMNPTPGSANSGALTEVAPAIQTVTENPPAPGENDPLPISATVRPRAGAVDSVTLTYRVGFGSEQSLPMIAQGNDTFTATIPASAYSAADMVRWFITASTAGGETSREPPFPDPTESPEYFGTVVEDPGITATLPVLHWFTQNPSAADTRGGTRASLYFAGRFYDNLFCRIRGQSTANWPKHKYKFDFNRGGHFFWKDGAPKVEEFNLNSHYRDSYVRENGIFAFLKTAGALAPETLYLWLRRNGSDFGLMSFVEQVDEEFLERRGIDPVGPMYKAINVPATLAPNPTTSLYRKVLQKNEPYTDLMELTANINISNPDRFLYVADEVNVFNYLNVMAAMAVPNNHDQLTKNYYLYNDPARDEWFRIAWDGDQGFANRSNQNWTSPLYGDALHTQELVNGNPNPVWQNHLHAAILDNPVTREMYMRRLRNLADDYLAIPEAGPEEVIISGTPGATTMRYFVPADGAIDGSWMDFAIDDSQWTSGFLGIGFENTPSVYDPLIATEVNPNVEEPGIASIYTRLEFDVPNPSAYQNLVLKMKYDDGFVAWMNGVEVARANVTGTPAYNSTASSHSDSLAVNFENFPLNGVTLLPGTNVLAIQCVNTSAGSSDLLMLPELVDQPGTGGGHFENLLNGFAAEIASDVIVDQALWSGAGITNFNSGLANILNSVLPSRRIQLFEQFGPPGEGLLPEKEPDNPVVEFGAIEFNPVSGNQDEEFIEIINNNPEAIDLSGWRVEGGIDFVFPPGAVIPGTGSVGNPERGKLFLSPNVRDFRLRSASPTGGEGRYVAGNYSGHLSNFGETLTLFDDLGRQVASTMTDSAPTDVQLYLVVSELMYHPATGGEEFIEVMNISDAVMLDLGGVTFTDGIDYSFPPGTMLAPGARLVVMQSQFQNGTALSNGGETIKLEDATGSTVAEFTYDDTAPWPASPDGTGPSLVLVRPASRPDPDIPTNWRASIADGGAPGGSDAIPYTGGDPLDYALLQAAGIELYGGEGIVLSYTLRHGADDAVITAEWSDDLNTWVDGQLAPLDQSPDGEGGILVRLQLPPGERGYARLRATILP